MPTNITQVEDPERNKTILRVEGEMFLDDAVLLEKIALGMREEIGRNITLDLSDLDFMDSESAPILKRMEREHHCRVFPLQGADIFDRWLGSCHQPCDGFRQLRPAHCVNDRNGSGGGYDQPPGLAQAIRLGRDPF